MIKKYLKRKLRKWLFADSDEHITRAFYEDMEKYKNSLDISALVREKLAGIDLSANLITEDHTANYIHHLSEAMKEPGVRHAMLRSAKQISQEPAFKAVLEWLIVSQVLFSVKRAANMDQVNFGRASINGIELVLEEIEYLANLFDSENKVDEPFDPHEVI